MKPTIEINEANFETEVLRSSQPVLVEFATGWSLPSMMLDGALDEIAAEFVDRLKVARVKLDRSPNLGLWYGDSMSPDDAVLRGRRGQHRDLRNHEQGSDSFSIETSYQLAAHAGAQPRFAQRLTRMKEM